MLGTNNGTEPDSPLGLAHPSDEISRDLGRGVTIVSRDASRARVDRDRGDELRWRLELGCLPPRDATWHEVAQVAYWGPRGTWQIR
eukprot:5311307-Prymnesium_polylepis.2